jgi:membrane protease YdiL (CAAX protease family)
MKQAEPYLPASVWTYGDAVALFFGGLLGSFVAIAVAFAFNGEDVPVTTQLVVSSLGQAAAVVALLFYMSRNRGTGSWELDYGLRFERRDWIGLMAGIGLQIAVILVVLLPLATILGIDNPPQQDVADIAESATTPLQRVAVLVILVVVAPFTEEILFRGVLLARLQRSMTATGAILVSSALFAGIHLIDPDAVFVVPGLFVIGIVLGYQAIRTGRIGLSIMTHAGVNLLAAVALLLDVEL